MAVLIIDLICLWLIGLKIIFIIFLLFHIALDDFENENNECM